MPGGPAAVLTGWDDRQVVLAARQCGPTVQLKFKMHQMYYGLLDGVETIKG
jgi:hypothetical protein